MNWLPNIFSRNQTSQKHLTDVLLLILLVSIYYLTAKLGIRLNSTNGYASLVWPPTGIALSFLFLFGLRLWPAIFIAAFLLNYSIKAPFFAAVGVGVGNTLEAVIACTLLRRVGFNSSLSHLRDAFLLILIGALFSTLISATIGVTSLWLFDAIASSEFKVTWQAWWMGDGMANLIVTPLILSWAYFFKTKQRIKNINEAAVMVITFSLLFFVLFSDEQKPLRHVNLQLPFLLFPFIIWAALRFGQVGASSVTFLTAICALWGAGYNYGPFAYGLPNENTLFLHTFLAVLAVTGLLVASVTTERAQTKQDLSKALMDLEEQTDQLEAILKSITDGITVIDENDRFIYTNEIGAKTCGYNSAEEMMRHSASEVIDKFEIMDENGAPFPLDQLPTCRALAGEVNLPEVIVRFRKKGGRDEKWSIIKSSPILHHKSKMRMAVNVFKDFTERKRLEDSIKYLDEASRVFNSSLNYEHTLTEIAKMAVNRIADWCSIDILRPGETQPHSVALQHINPDKLKFAQEFIKKFPNDWNRPSGPATVLKTGQSLLRKEIPEEVLRTATQNDEHYQLLSSLGLKSAMIVPISSRGKIFGVISLFSAESERVYTEDDLIFAEELARRGGIAIDNALLFEEAQRARIKMERLAEEARSANKVKSLFLANMSHEIRTPLGAILGFNSLIEDSRTTEAERKKYCDIISRNGKQLTQLIDDILDLSKVEADRLNIEIMEVALPALLTDITSLINQKAKEKSLYFNVISEGTTPPIIYTDPTRLRQILLNIIGNAIKFTSQGGVKVIVKTVPTNALHPESILITVEDSGPGIPEANQSCLFEWFSQAEASTTRKYGGTGLGLALSRRLARALKGDVVLTESSPSGTKFTILIANQIQDIRKPVLNKPSEKPLASLDTSNGRLKGLHVLLVEDSSDNRMLIECILSQKGVIIDSAENGQVGVQKALQREYDLVLMDIQMPVYDGLQATAELRQKGYQKPIVALTAHAMKEERERTLSIGCNAHLTKPIEIPKLLNIVAELAHPHH